MIYTVTLLKNINLILHIPLQIFDIKLLTPLYIYVDSQKIVPFHYNPWGLLAHLHPCIASQELLWRRLTCLIIKWRPLPTNLQ